MNAESIARALGNAKRAGNGWTSCCPAHEDKHFSLSITDKADKVVWKCHAGCSQMQVMDALKRLNLLPKFEKTFSNKEKKEKKPVIETFECKYDYVDESGNLLYFVERHKTNDPENPKTFKQKDPTGYPSISHVERRVLFNLPAVLKAIELGNPVLLPEGEKDCLNLMKFGFVATTNAGGGLGWKEPYNEQLRGADVIILPDNDDTGRKRTKLLCQNLVGIAKSVKVVPLYGEDGPKKADVSDWLNEGHSPFELFALIDAAPIQTAETVRVEEKNVIELYPVDEFINTDRANAKRLVKYFGEDLKYTEGQGWWVWDGKAWKVRSKLAAQEKGKQISRKIMLEAEQESIADKPEMMKWARKLEAIATVKAMLEDAMSDPEILVTESIFDVNPVLFNCSNGILNIDTKEFTPHKRESYLSKLGNVEYDPAAKCPTWEAFLKRVMNNDDEMIKFLQRAAGYSLSGFTNEQKVFFIYGPGGNGKSKFLIPIQELMGSYTSTLRSNAIMDTGRETQLDSLTVIVGARFVRASEITERAKLNEALIKDVSGGESIKARYLTYEPFDFKPKCKLWLHGNHKPRISGTDYGIWRRMVLIPFDEQITEEEKDKDLEEKLLAERNGILLWMIEGYNEWKEKGLNPPKKVLDATKEYETESDTVGLFLDERTKRVEGLSTRCGELYETYRLWCDENGFLGKLTKIQFSRDLHKRGIRTSEKRNGKGFKYLGVVLINEDSGNESENQNSTIYDNDQRSIF